MNPIIIVAETGSDITPELAAKYNITLVPMHVTFDSHTMDDGSFPVQKICDYYMQMFSSIDDEMFQQRATDVCDIKTRLLKILLDVEDVDLANVPEGTVLVAEDLTPSMTAGINPKNVTGILTEVGGKTSHSAILARALEIPAVLSIPGITEKISNGDKVRFRWLRRSDIY